VCPDLPAALPVFEAAHDVTNLGKVLGGLADAEDKRGHSDVAVGLQRNALRYCYLAADVASIQVSHHNLGNYFGYTGQLYPALAHHLAAALLRVITGSEGAEDSARAATADMRAAAEAALPADVAVLSARVGEVPGVHLDQLLTALADPAAVDQSLRELIGSIHAGGWGGA
jgi:hypothetical protein